ncbi:hypothetical protein LTR17_020802 [Elasticomyces elasticus]|nr:hypothetical protein LTR17_020802 [Elasticomyces elasticus]
MSSIDLEAPASVDNQAGYVNEMQVETTPAATELVRKDVPAASVAKRKATSTLEPDHNKKPRASSEGSEELAESISSKTDITEITEQPVTQTRTDLETKRAEAEAARYEQLQQEVRHLEKSTEKWRNKYCKVAEELDELKAQKSSRASGTGVSKRIEQSIKDDYKERMEAQKEQLDEKYKKQHVAYQKMIDNLRLKQAAALKEKDGNTEKRIKEIREKCDKRIEAAKDKAKEAKDELADDKKKMTEYKKQLKTEQQEEINKYKPSHSATVKEKDQAIKALMAEKAALEEEVKNHKKNVDLCEQDINRLTSDKEALEMVIEQLTSEKIALSNEVSLQARNIEIMLRRETEGEERAEARFEEEMAAWEDRLKHEGKRWVLQCDNAKDSAVRLVEQQRANHSLKGMVTSRDNSIRTLNAKVCELETAIVELKAVIAGHEIGIANLKTEDSKSASVTTVEEEGIASAEATDIKMKQELEPMDTASPEGSGEVSTLHGATQSMFGGGGERFAVDKGDEFAEKAAIDGTNANPGMLEQATATFTGLGEVETVAEQSHDEAMP